MQVYRRISNQFPYNFRNTLKKKTEIIAIMQKTAAVVYFTSKANLSRRNRIEGKNTAKRGRTRKSW